MATLQIGFRGLGLAPLSCLFLPEGGARRKVGNKKAKLGKQINFRSECEKTVTKLEVGDMVIFL